MKQILALAATLLATSLSHAQFSPEKAESVFISGCGIKKYCAEADYKDIDVLFQKYADQASQMLLKDAKDATSHPVCEDVKAVLESEEGIKAIKELRDNIVKKGKETCLSSATLQ